MSWAVLSAPRDTSKTDREIVSMNMAAAKVYHGAMVGTDASQRVLPTTCRLSRA